MEDDKQKLEEQLLGSSRPREADGGDPTRTRILTAVDDDADRHGDHPLDRRIDRPADGDEADPDDLHHHSSKVTP